MFYNEFLMSFVSYSTMMESVYEEMVVGDNVFFFYLQWLRVFDLYYDVIFIKFIVYYR